MSATSWRRRSFGSLFKVKHGYAFKGIYFSNSGDYIVLTPGNFRASGGIKLREGKDKYYTSSFPREFLLKSGDFLVVMTDLTQDAPILGSPAIVNEDNRFLHNQRLGKLIDISFDIDKKYLYFLFSSPSVRAQIRASASGATVRHTAPERIYQVNARIPGRLLQEKIASLLSAYDDLIENNLRRIKILEEMAQALYREWFVEFRFPGHERVRMVESSAGRIPEGWQWKPLGEVCDTASGGTPSRKNSEYFGGDIRWVKTKELTDGFIMDTAEHLTKLGLEKSSAKIFPESSVIVAMYGATIGKLGVLAAPAATNQACCAIMPRREGFDYAYIFLTLLNSRNDLISLGRGAAQQNISQVVIKGFQILVPNVDTAKAFTDLVEPLLSLSAVLQQQTNNLRQTRDLLLPRLISGDLDVSTLDIDLGEPAP